MRPRLNQNNTLVTVLERNTNGYKIFETVSFNKVSEDDDYQMLFGPLRFFIPLFESEFCVFVGTAANLNFPHDQIIIWDDSRKRKIGIIALKGTCDDLKLREEIIICSVNSEVIIFDIYSMKPILILDDCYPALPIAFNQLGNPISLVFQSKSNPSQVKICKIKLSKIEDSFVEAFIKKRNPNLMLSSFASLWKVTGKLHFVITTLFKEIYRYELSSSVSNLSL